VNNCDCVWFPDDLKHDDVSAWTCDHVFCILKGDVVAVDPDPVVVEVDIAAYADDSDSVVVADVDVGG